MINVFDVSIALEDSLNDEEEYDERYDLVVFGYV